MSRMDWKRGRFSTPFEIHQVEMGIRGFQASEISDSIDYWRFNFAQSTMDDTFDEGVNGGLVFHPVVNIPCLHVTHNEGGNPRDDKGFYYNDDLYVTTSYDLFYRSGLTEADIQHQKFLKDRILYDGLVFRVTQINILGQVGRRDTIVSMEATQVKPDEMSNDPQFAKYAVQGKPNPWNYG